MPCARGIHARRAAPCFTKKRQVALNNNVLVHATPVASNMSDWLCISREGRQRRRHARTRWSLVVAPTITLGYDGVLLMKCTVYSCKSNFPNVINNTTQHCSGWSAILCSVSTETAFSAIEKLDPSPRLPNDTQNFTRISASKEMSILPFFDFKFIIAIHCSEGL